MMWKKQLKLNEKSCVQIKFEKKKHALHVKNHMKIRSS